MYKEATKYTGTAALKQKVRSSNLRAGYLHTLDLFILNHLPKTHSSSSSPTLLLTDFLAIPHLYLSIHLPFLRIRPDTMGSVGEHLPYRLDGKVALVTGAGRGIGASIAVQLGRNGAKVVVNYANSSASAEKVVAEIKALGGDAVAIQANVREVKETVKLFEDAKAHYGHLDIVVSNAGVVSFGHLSEVTEASTLWPWCLSSAGT